MQIYPVQVCTPELQFFIRTCIEKTFYQDKKEISYDRIKQTVEQIANDKDGMCIVAVDPNGLPIGIVLGQCIPELFSDEKIGQMILWYVPNNPKLALAMSGVFDEWVKRKGVKRLGYASPMIPQLDKLYKRKGFTEVERSFQKEI